MSAIDGQKARLAERSRRTPWRHDVAPLARRTAIVSALAAVAITLAGCVGDGGKVADSSPSASPSRSALAPSPDAEQSPEPLVAPEGWAYVVSPATRTGILVEADCVPHVAVVTLGSGTEEDPSYEYVTPYDLGPRDFAQGTVVRDDAGTITGYIVADGDARGAIMDRLCTELPMIQRSESGEIQPGDLLDFTPEGIDAALAAIFRR